ncbi:MAG: sulfurtransferase complex subunit TusC [Cellvibrionaceae bacterium]|nr:sulfurtransferase complex subunit TusC [Cellvibrionaceae bacterium]MCV6625092.1 sulfurtransferase complex subunit TusC [Cellvibrionaceae bacterium]
MNNKAFTLISSSPPYGSSKSRELIDIALAGGVFEQQISLLLLGDGVFALLAEQHPAAIEQKNHGKLMAMLELYGIENILVAERALGERGLTEQDLAVSVSPLDDKAIGRHLARQDVCINL